MIAELGHYALIFSLVTSVLLGVIPILSAHRHFILGMSFAKPLTVAGFIFIFISFLCLAWSFYVNDFSVLYVAQNSNTELPLMYRLGAVWGAHEGSLLLWVLFLSLWSIAVCLFSRSLELEFLSRVLGVLGLVQTGILLFILLTSNPFLRLLPVPAQGRELNPMLQDPGLIFHPPWLYMGYVGLAVPFAFAVAALLYGKLDTNWAKWSRPWTLLAWCFLTGGIFLGSHWAYYILGWGGWWFWDPVENASLIPWLVATALFHSLIVTEKRGSFRAWTVLLAIAGFSLSLVGTFLVRSGVITSVHAFATDPKRGSFILLLLVIYVGSSLTLFAWRSGTIRVKDYFALLSKESLLLMGNIILVVMAASVLLGTIYPLIIEAFGQSKLSIGTPYFNRIIVPLAIPLFVLMALAPLIRWKKTTWSEVMHSVRWSWLISLVVLTILFFFYQPNFWVMLGFFFALIVLCSLFFMIFQRLKRSRKLSASFLGMILAHAGLAIFVIGVTVVQNYSIEKDVSMQVNDQVSLGAYQIDFLGIEASTGPNYLAEEGRFAWSNKEESGTLWSQTRQYATSSLPLTQTGIDSSFTRDIYIALAEKLPGGLWTVRLHYKPFINWIWLGGLLMTLGGLLALLDRRYRTQKQRVSL